MAVYLVGHGPSDDQTLQTPNSCLAFFKVFILILVRLSVVLVFLPLSFFLLWKIFFRILYLTSIIIIGLDFLWLVDRFPNRYRCDRSRSFSVTFISRWSVMVCITTLPAFSSGDSGIPWEKIELRLVYCSCRSILCSNYSICFSILTLLFCRFLTVSSFVFFSFS